MVGEWGIDILIFIYNEGGRTTIMYTLRRVDNTFIFFRGTDNLSIYYGGTDNNLSIYYRGDGQPKYIL